MRICGRVATAAVATATLLLSSLSCLTGEVSWSNAGLRPSHLFVSSPDHAPRAAAPVLGLDRVPESVRAVTGPDSHSEPVLEPAAGSAGRVAAGPATRVTAITEATPIALDTPGTASAADGGGNGHAGQDGRGTEAGSDGRGSGVVATVVRISDPAVRARRAAARRYSASAHRTAGSRTARAAGADRSAARDRARPATPSRPQPPRTPRAPVSPPPAPADVPAAVTRPVERSVGSPVGAVVPDRADVRSHGGPHERLVPDGLAATR